MEQVPQDTAKQILQARESYGTASTQFGTPNLYSQSQISIGAISNKMMNSNLSKNIGLFGEQMPKQTKKEKTKLGVVKWQLL